MEPIRHFYAPEAKPHPSPLSHLRLQIDSRLWRRDYFIPRHLQRIDRSPQLQPHAKIYGPDFNFHEYLPTTGPFAGIVAHLILRLVMLIVSFPPVQWLAEKYLIPASGTGPDLATAATSERQEFVAIGVPLKSNGDQVSARYVYEGSLYYCSALMGVEAAFSILGEKTYAHDIGGGILTPATLGMPFVERLRNAGIKIEVDA